MRSKLSYCYLWGLRHDALHYHTRVGGRPLHLPHHTKYFQSIGQGSQLIKYDKGILQVSMCAAQK